MHCRRSLDIDLTGPRDKRRVCGFSLLEMSIVLLIIGLIVGGGAIMISHSVEKRQREETMMKLQAVQNALLDFRRAFNRLPCPGDLTLTLTDADMGKEAAKATASTASCSGGSPAANFTNSPIEIGAVPVRTLGLPDDYLFDAWGRRMVYAVDNRLTVEDAFDDVDVSDTTDRITIYGPSASVRTADALYALLSHGPNGHGAYPRNGGSTRIFMGSTNTAERANCNCNATAATATVGAYYQMLPTTDSTSYLNTFDDMTLYGTRQDLRLSYE